MNKPTLEPFEPDDGMHMTLGYFIEACKHGSFVDDDGFGELATDTQVSRCPVSPSEYRTLQDRVIDIEALTGVSFTHVLWFNK